MIKWIMSEITMFTLLISAIQMFMAEIILRNRNNDSCERSRTGRIYTDTIALTGTDAIIIDVREFRLTRKNKSLFSKNTHFLYNASLKRIVNGVVVSDISDWYPPMLNSSLIGSFVLLDIACLHINRNLVDLGK